MKKVVYSIFAFLMTYNVCKSSIAVSYDNLILEANYEPPIYSGHHSHSSHTSHASHYSSVIGSRDTPKTFLLSSDSISSVPIDAKLRDKHSLKCIVKTYTAYVHFSDSTTTHFKGKALIIIIKDDYGDDWRSPRIRVTTHIIPLDFSENKYFTSDFIGYHDLSSMNSSLQSDLQNQFNKEWLLREKKSWMYAFDNDFFKNILNLIN